MYEIKTLKNFKEIIEPLSHLTCRMEDEKTLIIVVLHGKNGWSRSGSSVTTCIENPELLELVLPFLEEREEFIFNQLINILILDCNKFKEAIKTRLDKI